jgi:hypothetical protein
MVSLNLAGAIDFNTEMAVLMSTGCGARSAAAAFALVYRFFRAIFAPAKPSAISCQLSAMNFRITC